LFARLPHAGEEIDYDKFRFRIASVDTRRIKRVKVTIKNEETDETNRELT
jgi:Mg2+/Co2+ transporter CorC